MQPRGLLQQSIFLQYIYSMLLAKNQKIRSNCLVNEFFLMISIMVTEQLYWRKVLFGCLRFIWLWLLVAIRNRCAERCELMADESCRTHGGKNHGGRNGGQMQQRDSKTLCCSLLLRSYKDLYTHTVRKILMLNLFLFCFCLVVLSWPGKQACVMKVEILASQQNVLELMAATSVKIKTTRFAFVSLKETTKLTLTKL